MSANDTINRMLGALGDHVLKTEHKSPRRVYIEIAPETVFRDTTGATAPAGRS